MASSQSNSHSEPAKIEQIITGFFSKSLHIILESRCPYASSRNYSGEQTVSSPSSSSSSSSVRPRDKWFNLALRECPVSLDNLDFWRQSCQSYHEPLILDVVLVYRSQNPSAAPHHVEMTREKVIERWVLQFESRKDSKSGGKKMGSTGSHCSESRAVYNMKTYKRAMILLRSLYLTVRLLPAYKLFRDLNSTGQISPFSLTYRVSSLVEPFSRREEAEMQSFGFAPVDAYCGRLCLSVVYRPKLLDVNAEPSTPIFTQFIADYVGSPTTDPLKRFPSLPFARLASSPSPVVFARRHSWSNDLHRAAVPSVSPSPSPTYSYSHRLPPRSHPNMDPSPPLSLPHHPVETPRSSDVSSAHKKNISFDDSWPSPPFSLSPSPSPPTHLLSGHSSKALLRTGSAPVSIPSVGLGRNLGLANHVLPPSPSPKGLRPGCSPHSENIRPQVSRVSISQSSPPESKYLMKQDPLRSGESRAGMAVQKVFSFGKDEVGHFPGAKISSCSSPRISSRSSSRLSFQDDFDDSEFACPFAVDDDDITDPSNRSESFDGKGHVGEELEPGVLLPIRKSQDAAVGALVHMLNTAPPLRQDCSNLEQVSKAESWSKRIQTNDNSEPRAEAVIQNAASDAGITESRLLMLKTTEEAMEELRGYREMKELLLRQGGHQSLDAAPVVKTLGRGSTEF
ncbi:autophagy-related protein 13b [Magnolia sinica]|uniref:autophagy-related protein 13b n=1 Tax=Magnolia sinica TaxID=86752 RepID=UPI00265AD487|nr:autophagy-related protein 13b [Magnolia sinica]